MFQVKRNEFPSNTVLTTFEVIIDDEKMNKRIVKIIDKQGDKQNHGTAVKAQMSDWQMMEQPGFKQLAEIIVNVAAIASEERFNRKISPIIKDMWGMKYKSEEIAIPHDHYPALLSCAYYINPPEGAPGLYFPEADIERKIENGLLILFEGNVKHGVKPTKYEGYRYVVSANIYHFCMILKKK